MRRVRFTDLAIVGLGLMLAGTAFAQTTSPGSSTGTPGSGTGPTSPQPVPSPAQPGIGTQQGSGNRPSVGSGAIQPRPSVGQSTPPGTTAPGTPIPGTSSVSPAGNGQASGEQVRSVQQALQGKGMDPGAIDGVIGPKTQAALRNFQKEQNLPQTGRLDAQTLEKLGVSQR